MNEFDWCELQFSYEWWEKAYERSLTIKLEMLLYKEYCSKRAKVYKEMREWRRSKMSYKRWRLYKKLKLVRVHYGRMKNTNTGIQNRLSFEQDLRLSNRLAKEDNRRRQKWVTKKH
jgi:hypothetical protein